MCTASSCSLVLSSMFSSGCGPVAGGARPQHCFESGARCTFRHANITCNLCACWCLHYGNWFAAEWTAHGAVIRVSLQKRTYSCPDQGNPGPGGEEGGGGGGSYLLHDGFKACGWAESQVLAAIPAPHLGPRDVHAVAARIVQLLQLHETLHLRSHKDPQLGVRQLLDTYSCILVMSIHLLDTCSFSPHNEVLECSTIHPFTSDHATARV